MFAKIPRFTGRTLDILFASFFLLLQFWRSSFDGAHYPRDKAISRSCRLFSWWSTNILRGKTRLVVISCCASARNLMCFLKSAELPLLWWYNDTVLQLRKNEHGSGSRNIGRGHKRSFGAISTLASWHASKPHDNFPDIRNLPADRELHKETAKRQF